VNKVSTSCTDLTLVINAPTTIDLTTDHDLVITIIFTDTDIGAATKSCIVLSPTTGTNTCTWSSRTLVYTGNNIDSSAWAASSSKTFEFRIVDFTI
jgi:hypothetical protein